MILEAQRDAATKAVKDATDATREYGTKAATYTKDLGDKATALTKDTSDRVAAYGKDTSDKVATFSKDTSDKVVTFSKETGDKAMETVPYLETISDFLAELFESGKDFAVQGYTSVKEFKIGDKAVSERAHATVETVSEAIDVEQIQDQVTKLRHQMEGVLQNWTDTFRPSEATPAKAAPKAKVVEEKAKATPKKPGKDLKAMTKADLMEMARKKNVKGRSSMNKKQLIDALS